MNRLTCLTLALATLAAGAAHADGFPRPRADFSAEATLQTGAMTLESKVYHSGSKDRREHHVQGRNQIIIVRGDKRRVWVLLPEPHMVMEMDLAEATPSVGVLPEGARVDRSRVGEETLNGQATTKYKIEVTQRDGAKLEGTMWLTPDDIVMKLEARAQGSGSQTFLNLELRNLRRGKQDPSLFELPPGYTAVPAGGGGDADTPPQP
jgi:hypothetical protein